VIFHEMLVIDGKKLLAPQPTPNLQHT